MADMDLTKIKRLLIEEQARITLQHYEHWGQLNEFEKGYQMCLDKWLPIIFHLMKLLNENVPVEKRE